MCWCKKAKDYTNEVRRKNGVGKMLKLGTKKQMDNAMGYAKKLGGMGYLKHQDLSKVTREVGCQRWMGGENLAFNYEQNDIAKMCVDQWVKSKGHFENLIRDWFEEVVVGFHFRPDGRVYCVQTFALPYPRGTFGRPGDNGCQPVDADSAPTPPPPTTLPPTTLPPTTLPPTTKAPPQPASKSEPAPTAPAPRRGNLSAPTSCSCIRYGKGCRPPIAREAGNGCVARRQRSKQPMSCKTDCCDFCEKYPNVGVCAHRHLVRICGKV